MAFQNWVEPYVFTSKKKKKKRRKKKVDLKNNSKNASEKWPFIGHLRLYQYLKRVSFLLKNRNVFIKWPPK